MMMKLEILQALYEGKKINYNCFGQKSGNPNLFLKDGKLVYDDSRSGGPDWNEFMSWGNLNWYVVKELKLKDVKFGDCFRFLNKSLNPISYKKVELYFDRKLIGLMTKGGSCIYDGSDKNEELVEIVEQWS